MWSFLKLRDPKIITTFDIFVHGDTIQWFGVALFQETPTYAYIYTYCMYRKKNIYIYIYVYIIVIMYTG